MKCKYCGKEILTFKDYSTKNQCRECRNKYYREYYDKNFKTLVRKYSSNGQLTIETHKKFFV